jgi:hypothetical protein
MPRSAILVFWLSSCIGEISDVPPVASTYPVRTGRSVPIPDASTTTPDASTSAPDASTPLPDAGSPAVDAGPVDPCASVTCTANAHCTAGTCTCDPGFVAMGSACVAGDPGVPALRSQQQVCDAWTAGHVVKDNTPFSKSTAMCDPGALSRQGIDDALTRLDLFRYLAGLGPVTDDAQGDSDAQACSLIAAWNPAGPSAHFPPPSSTCYSGAGAGAAGESNIAWGCSSPSDAIDQWFVDFGNETSFGHRRWLLNPPLGPVGMGFYEGGNNYGSASCIEVFGSGGSGPSPAYVAFPPPGFVPVDIVGWTWTVQGDIPGDDAGVSITDSMGHPLGAAVQMLDGYYGQSAALRIDLMGWSPQEGQTYHVTLTGNGHAAIEYDVKPVSCP